MKNIKVGQRLIFVKSMNRSNPSAQQVEVVKVGRKYATIKTIGELSREIRIVLETMRDENENYPGKLYESMESYLAHESKRKAVEAVYLGIYRSGRTMLGKLPTESLILIGEMLGIDMSAAKAMEPKQ